MSNLLEFSFFPNEISDQVVSFFSELLVPLFSGWP